MGVLKGHFNTLATALDRVHLWTCLSRNTLWRKLLKSMSFLPEGSSTTRAVTAALLAWQLRISLRARQAPCRVSQTEWRQSSNSWSATYWKGQCPSVSSSLSPFASAFASSSCKPAESFKSSACMTKSSKLHGSWRFVPVIYLRFCRSEKCLR